ncbi:hypothetical protein [Flavobacterium sp. 3HN19-14]|uniref:hypothetical protein n=1 Tax=Flavobacterium sp. 3HN19-14 TaxID=3448133 RepID=UPI003EE30FBD
MKRILEDTNTLLASIVGTIGGLIWAIKTSWDYEPVILLSVSVIGLLSFLGIKIFVENVRPIVEVELNQTGSNDSPMMMAPGISPQNNEGYYLSEEDGIYHYEFEHQYDLVIRNNSINNAYNVNIYVEDKYFLKFQNYTSSLEPLMINKPKVIKVKYEFGENMTQQQSLDELSVKFNDQLKKTNFIIEYQDENRKTYFTQFNAPKTNQILKKNPKFDKSKYRLIS